ncbi:MAG: hypothetical protein ACRDRT_19585, partial [Pseudonocardiaceae bacterium]
MTSEVEPPSDRPGEYADGSGLSVKLILFSTIGPDREDSAYTAFSLAHGALGSGLEVEIFLAGAATGLLRHHVRTQLEGRTKE